MRARAAVLGMWMIAACEEPASPPSAPAAAVATPSRAVDAGDFRAQRIAIDVPPGTVLRPPPAREVTVVQPDGGARREAWPLAPDAGFVERRLRTHPRPGRRE